MHPEIISVRRPHEKGCQLSSTVTTLEVSQSKKKKGLFLLHFQRF
jgi:hypothetical protein